MRFFGPRGGGNDSLIASKLWSFYGFLSKPDLRVFIFWNVSRLVIILELPRTFFWIKFLRLTQFARNCELVSLHLTAWLNPFERRFLEPWSSRILTKNFLPFLMHFCSNQNARARVFYYTKMWPSEYFHETGSLHRMPEAERLTVRASVMYNSFKDAM